MDNATSMDFECLEAYDRGPGVNPHVCGPDQLKVENMCNSKCPLGYSLSGAVCRQNCPGDFKEIDYYCRRDPKSYGRGAGYPWKFGDGVGNDLGMLSRCAEEHGKDNCEKYGSIFYPKCKPGYKSVGCCICTLSKEPDCNALGMGSNIFDFSCLRKAKAPNETNLYTLPPSHCSDNEEMSYGLCYKKCRDGYIGKGSHCEMEFNKKERHIIRNA
jgi:hypothetical protein